MSALSELEGLSAELEKVKKAITDRVENLMVAAFKEEVFDKFSKVKSIRMKGFAPYFNDGEPCYFSTHEPEISLGDDDFIDAWGYNSDDDDEDEGDEDALTEKERKKIFAAVNSVFSEVPDDIFEDAFGSDQVVTFYSNGKVDNDQYGDHD